MALNPSDQDKGGVVRPQRNLGNSYNSGDPLGESVASVPDAISDLALASIGTTSANLTWTLPSGATGVKVERQDVTGSGSYTLIATLGAVSSYGDTNLSSSNEYNWRVLPFNGNGDAASYSNVVNGTTSAQVAGSVTVASADNGGVNFQGGPTVIMFDRFDGAHGAVIPATRTPDVGGPWTAKNADGSGETKFYRDLGRGWMCQRDVDLIDTSTISKTRMYFAFGANYAQFRFAHRRWVPTDKIYPGASAPQTCPSSGSTWKPTWFAGAGGSDLTGTGGSTGQADLVFDSSISGGCSILNTGNSITPRSNNPVDGSSLGLFYGKWSHNSPTFSTYYQSGAESAQDAFDATFEMLAINDEDFKFLQRDDVSTFDTDTEVWSSMVKSYAAMNFGGWIADGANDPGVAPLISDCYLAVGANSRACIITSDSAALSTSTEAYILPPDSWSTSEITFSPLGYENLGFVHLILADGTLLENVVTS